MNILNNLFRYTGKCNSINLFEISTAAIVTSYNLQSLSPGTWSIYGRRRYSSNFENAPQLSSDTGSGKHVGQPSVDSLAKNVALHDMPVEMENPYERVKKVCILCKYGIQLDYKNPKLLSQFLSPFTGQLYEKHITRLCDSQQRSVKKEIQKSREAGYLSVMVKSTEFLKDPQIFDPNNPIKPHKY